MTPNTESLNSVVDLVISADPPSSTTVPGSYAASAENRSATSAYKAVVEVPENVLANTVLKYDVLLPMLPEILPVVLKIFLAVMLPATFNPVLPCPQYDGTLAPPTPFDTLANCKPGFTLAKPGIVD